MAKNTKKPAKSTARASAKNTGKKADKPTASQRKAVELEQNQRQIGAIILLAVGLLVLALTFIKGDKVWMHIHNFIFGILGWSAYFIAPLILYLATTIARDKPIHSLKTKLWQVGVLLLLLSAAIEIFTGLPEVQGITSLVKTLYQKGMEKNGGGVFGAILAVPLTALGSPAPHIIIVLAIFVFVMLLTGSTLLHLVQLLRKPVEGIENAYHTQREDRLRWEEEHQAGKPAEPVFTFQEEEDRLNKARFDINVDISADKEPGEFRGREPVEIPELVTAETSLYDSLRYQNQQDTAAVAHAPDTNTRPLPPQEEFVFPTYIPREGEESLFSAEHSPFAPPVPPSGSAPLGVDSPVEYLGAMGEPCASIPLEYPSGIGTALPVFSAPHQSDRQHPLEEDIRLAQENDLSQAINRYLHQIKTGEEAEPLWQEEQDLLGHRFSAAIEQAAAEPFPTVVQPPVQPPAPPPPISSPVSAGEQQTLFEQKEHSKPSYRFPPLELLKLPKKAASGDIGKELRENAEKLVETLESFGVETKIVNISRGPSVTRYELQPSPGVKISRITGLADDIALNLAAAGIRIEAPIPGKAAVGIEIPNKTVSMVGIREIMDSPEFKKPSEKVSIALGRNITGNTVIADIAGMPHVLIAGSTGSGKSVCINSIIISILYKYSPEQVKLIMIDPKVVELGIYNGIPHLLMPVVTEPKKAASTLFWAVGEMLNRYKTFASNSVRDLVGYNRLAERSEELEKMPQVVIIIDELSDLMMAAPNEVEDSICRLAQMARAAGMHLVIATQRPSVDVITGIIKANIPSRIAFAVSSQVDSRTILDGSGAEKLLGRGDMLFYPTGAAKPARVQGCFVSDGEVERVINYIKETEKPEYDESIMDEIEKMATQGSGGTTRDSEADDADEFIEVAMEIVIEAGQASISMLQRRLSVGYARAGRLIDQLEQMGVVGPHEGSKPRQVLMTLDQFYERRLMNQSLLQHPTPEAKPDAE